MAKSKKKNAKKDTVADDMLDVAVLSIKKFRKVTKEIGKLSTGQKLVGGLALLATGLTYLAKSRTDEEPSGQDASTWALEEHASAKSRLEDSADADEAGEAQPKARKFKKAKSNL
jgi:hypothetical protein